jgi:hypothetical protein
MARAKQSKEPIFELGKLTLPKNHGKQQANECARRIRSRIPYVRIPSLVQPILQTLIPDPKTYAKNQ